MKKQISKAEAHRFKKRWEAVNAAERRELRATPVGDKLLQLAALMAWAEKLGWNDAVAAEEAAVRDRWNRLRKAPGG